MRRYPWRTVIFIVLILSLATLSLVFPRFNLNFLGVQLDRDGMVLGLDLQGGSYLIYQASIEAPSADQMQGAINIIERRVNSYGVSEPVVQQFGENRIILQLPGVENIQEAKDLIGATALLEYKQRECLDLDNDPGCLLSFTDKEIGLTGEYMTSAFVDNIPATGEPIVSVIFNSDGAKLLSELTKNIAQDDSKRIAIFLDDLLIMAAQAQEVILGGRGYISGGFTFDSARTLAIQLESCLLYTSPSPRDRGCSRMPSSA